MRLERAGVHVLDLPCVAVRPLADATALRRAVRSLSARDRLVITSRAGAEAVAAALAGDPIAAPVAVIGAATHAAARRAGIEPDFAASVPDTATLARELPLPRGTTLLARSDRAGRELPEMLRARGADVREVIAYHTERASATEANEARAALAGSHGESEGDPVREDRADALVFLASPSGVDAFIALVGEGLARRARPVTIGPRTAAHVRRRLGVEPRVASSPDPDAAAAVILELVRGTVDANAG
jgi:uroporphyrinogen-III synthase